MLFGLKFILFTLFSLVFFIFATILVILRPFNPRIFLFLARLFCLTGLKIFGIRLDFKAPEWFHKNSPKIVVANHQGSLDVLLVGAIIPPNTLILGKTAIFFIPLFGLCFWLTGHIFIDRSNGKKARLSMERVNHTLAKEKKSIWIMPEGTRSKGRDILLPFKRGAFITAIRTGTPIVPVCFSPYSGLSCTNIAATVLPPIEPQGSVDELMEKTYREMRATIAKLEGKGV